MLGHWNIFSEARIAALANYIIQLINYFIQNVFKKLCLFILPVLHRCMVGLKRTSFLLGVWQNVFIINCPTSSFSFLKQPCWKTHPVVLEKMLVCLRKVKTLAASSKEMSGETAETNRIGLRTVQRIGKAGGMVRNNHHWGRNIVGRTNLNVWGNQNVEKQQ